MKKGLIFGGVAVVLVAIAVVGTVFFMSKNQAHAEKVEPTPVHVEGKLGPSIKLKDRVFNLANSAGGTKHFLKLETTIEFETIDPSFYKLVGKPLEKKLEEFDKDEIGSSRQIIEDIVTSIVSGKKLEDISTAAGKDELRQELLDAIAEKIHEPKVAGVYFTSFVTD